MAKTTRKAKEEGKKMMPLPIKKQEEYLPPSILPKKEKNPEKKGEFSVSGGLFFM